MNGSVPEVAERTLTALGRRRIDRAEVYLKEGRSRTFATGLHGTEVGIVEESGWAVRAGDRHCSFFVAGTGRPEPDRSWPEPDGYPLRLPEPGTTAAWREPSELDSPLLGEREGLSLVAEIDRALGEELPGARLVSSLLVDGSSRSWILSTKGIRGSWRQRVASLRVEARAGSVGVELGLCERDARRFHPATVARALADRLAVAGRPPADRDRAEMLLAPSVGARLLRLFAPYWVGHEAERRLAELADQSGRVGSAAFTLVDDGRLPGGLLSAPVDGEGVPTREVVIVEEGRPRQPLVPWWQVRGDEVKSSGCSQRASWRDLPRPGPTHLYLRPHRPQPTVAMVRSVGRGYYLLDSPGEGRLDLDNAQFSLPVYGFRLESGRAVDPVAGVELRGTVPAFLRGIRSVGRDVSFFPGQGMIGSPTLSVSGLELAPAGPPIPATPSP